MYIASSASLHSAGILRGKDRALGPRGDPRTLASNAYKNAAELPLPGLQDLQEPCVLSYRLQRNLPVALYKFIQELIELWYACGGQMNVHHTLW